MKYLLSITLVCLPIILKSQSLDEFTYNWEASEQTKKERVSRDTLRLDSVLLALEAEEFYEFAYLDADNDGNLAFYNFTRDRIIILPSNNYSEYKELGNGRGRGPGEIELARDIKFNDSGSLWLVDLENINIQKWNSYGDLEKNFKPRKKHLRPYRIAVCEEFLYILSEQYLKDGLYHRLNFSGDVINSFKLIENKKKETERLWRNASYFRGDIQCDGEDLVHVGTYKNYIRKYSKNGELKFSKKIIGPDVNPEPLLYMSKRSRGRKENVKTLSGNVEIVGDKIFVSHSGKKRWYYHLDIYDNNGEYLESYYFKHPVQEFTTNGKYLYTIEYHKSDANHYIARYLLP